MKRLLSALVVALVLCAQPASAAYVLLGHTAFQPTTGSSGTGTATTANVDTTGADLITVALSYNISGSDPPLEDARSGCAAPCNTWNARTVYSAPNRAVRIFWAQPTSVGAGHSFTSVPPLNNYISIYVAWFSGSLASTPFDGENGANTASATSLSTGTVTPSASGDLMIAAISNDNAASATIAGYTITDQFDLNTGPFSVGGALAYKIKTDALVETPSWGWTGANQAGVTLTAFKAAGGGGGGSSAPPCALRLLGVGCEVH